MGAQEVTTGYRRFWVVKEGYKGLKGVTRG